MSIRLPGVSFFSSCGPSSSIHKHILTTGQLEFLAASAQASQSPIHTGAARHTHRTCLPDRKRPQSTNGFLAAPAGATPRAAAATALSTARRSTAPWPASPVSALDLSVTALRTPPYLREETGAATARSRAAAPSRRLRRGAFRTRSRIPRSQGRYGDLERRSRRRNRSRHRTS